MVFNLIVLWCVQGMPEGNIKATWWKRNLYYHLLPFLWIVIAVFRVGLGTTEWLIATGGERHHSGTVNAVKHCLTCMCLLGVCVTAILSSINEEKIKRKEGGGQEYVEEGAKKINNKGHLTLMLLVLIIYSVYTITEAVPRIGKIEKWEAPECTFSDRMIYTQQASILVTVLVYLIVSSCKKQLKSIEDALANRCFGGADATEQENATEQEITCEMTQNDNA